MFNRVLVTPGPESPTVDHGFWGAHGTHSERGPAHKRSGGSRNLVSWSDLKLLCPLKNLPDFCRSRPGPPAASPPLCSMFRGLQPYVAKPLSKLLAFFGIRPGMRSARHSHPGTGLGVLLER